MKHAVNIVDTGYLLALLNVPGETQPPDPRRQSMRARNVPKAANEVEEVVRRFAEARAKGDSCVVPLAVLYEVASHITDIAGSRSVARQCAQDLLKLVRLTVPSATGQELFEIEPRPDLVEFEQVLTLFANDHVMREHSLTDTAIVALAAAKKREHPDRMVHIWTWERRRTGIRALSPDPEAVPFPGWSE